MTNEAPAPLGAEPAIDNLGHPCVRVPLTGGDGGGRYALLDDSGLAKLKEAGAKALYLLSDGQGRSYVSFVRFPQKRAITAARAIMGDPEARRIEYVNGDRLDLRSRNLRVRDYAGVGVSRAAERR